MKSFGTVVGVARFALKADRVTLAEMALAAVSLAALPARGEPVLRVLVVLVRGLERLRTSAAHA